MYPHPSVHHIFEFYRLGDILNSFLATCPSSHTLQEVEIALGPITVTPDSLCSYFYNASAGDVNMDSPGKGGKPSKRAMQQEEAEGAAAKLEEAIQAENLSPEDAQSVVDATRRRLNKQLRLG